MGAQSHQLVAKNQDGNVQDCRHDEEARRLRLLLLYLESLQKDYTALDYAVQGADEDVHCDNEEKQVVEREVV